MSRIQRHFILPVAAALALTALAPSLAVAREGSARSVGHGIKCYTAAVTGADGKVTYTRVCYKGV
jgi:cytochrome c5